MWYVCGQLYMDQTKKIFDHFICIWKWFLSLFVFMFSAYFVLNMFCVEKQVSEFFATHFATRQSQNLQVVSSSRSCCNSLATHENFRNSPNYEMPKNSFLKSFSWEICFKRLTSSLKPLFQYFYIKTQSIWMVFHSINISKLILNSFHWFGSLDYVLESFVLLVGIFIIGVWKTFFLSNFWMGSVSFDDFLWMLAPCGKKNMY